MKKMKSLFALLLCAAMCTMSMSVAFAGGPETTAEDAMTTGAKEGASYTLTSKDQAALAEKEKMAETLQMQRAGTTVSVSMGHTRQIVGYYCGPASVQNTLAAFGVTVPSTTKSLYFYQANESASNCPYPNVNHTHYKSYTSPQITLANEMGTTYSGTDFAKLVTALNKYQRDWGYSAAHIDDTVNATNIDNLAKKVKLSLRNGAPVVMWVQADLLQQYQGKGKWSGHYLCGEAYNDANDVMTISDPNYYSKIAVRYTETASSIVNAIWVNSSTNGNLIW